jgi:hypothetical protein
MAIAPQLAELIGGAGMKRSYLWLSLSILLIFTLSIAAARRDDSATVTVPSGTAIHVRLDNALSTKQNRPGDEFTATVSEPLVVDGQIVIPQGARARGLVVDARESGRLKGAARMRLELTSVEVNGNSYLIQTADAMREGGNHKKRNWYSIGGGAAGGAVIGAIAGGGEGALIGGPIGAGAGLTYALVTGKKDVRLPAETRLTFKLAQPVIIRPAG